MNSSAFDNLPALIQQLAQRFVWVAPVGNAIYRGNPDLRGFMVCKRSINNGDGKNTRVDYLMVAPTELKTWKKPFRECEHMFPSLEAAYEAAVRAMNLHNPTP